MRLKKAKSERLRSCTGRNLATLSRQSPSKYTLKTNLEIGRSHRPLDAIFPRKPQTTNTPGSPGQIDLLRGGGAGVHPPAVATAIQIVLDDLTMTASGDPTMTVSDDPIVATTAEGPATTPRQILEHTDGNIAIIPGTQTPIHK